MALPRRVLSLGHAFRGVVRVLATQRNAQIQVCVTGAVLGAGAYFSLSLHEWVVVLLCIGAVLSAECANTAHEFLADAVHPEHSEKIRDAKDAAAAAVLVVSCIAAVVGAIIFLPHLLAWLRG